MKKFTVAVLQEREAYIEVEAENNVLAREKVEEALKLFGDAVFSAAKAPKCYDISALPYEDASHQVKLDDIYKEADHDR